MVRMTTNLMRCQVNLFFLLFKKYSRYYFYNNNDSLCPAPYCKQLYIDVTNTNNGKITWRQIKPIIQGKIIYGPGNAGTDEIARLSNKTFNDMNRLKEFFKTIDTSIKMLKQNGTFRENFDSLVNLAKSPFVKALLGDAFDASLIETVLDAIITDPRVGNILEVVGNIFECFSPDRFISVQTEKELEDMAYELNHKKLFYAGVFFTNLDSKDISYKLRMNIDDTPVTIEATQDIDLKPMAISVTADSAPKKSH